MKLRRLAIDPISPSTARRRSAGGELGEDFRQWHEVRHRAGGCWRQRLRLAAVSEHLDPVLDADRQRLPADRATPPVCQRFLRREPHLAFAMAVEMIFAFVGKELDRADVTVTGLQCMFDGEVVALAVEGGRLPPELAGRMRVGIGGKAIAVE